MMKMKNLVFLGMFLTALAVGYGGIANFDDLSLGANSAWSGDYVIDGVGGSYGSTSFSSGTASFDNYSDGDWGSWAGFGYSNQVDNTTPGFGNQFSSYAGSAQSGSNFGVGFQDSFNGINPTMTLNTEMVVDGIYATNTTYAGLAMRDGDSFAKQFGGVTGDDADWFMLTIEGFNSVASSTGTVDFYLADYRFADNAQDYILDSWGFVDLTSLGSVKSLEFSLSSSDTGSFGMNTPSYFAVDTVVPEPASICLLTLGSVLLRRRK